MVGPRPELNFGPPSNFPQPRDRENRRRDPDPIAVALFAALDPDRTGALTRVQMENTFARWFKQWDATKTGFLNENQLRDGLLSVLPQSNPGPRPPSPAGGERVGERGQFGGARGFRGGRGPRLNIRGVELDPLVGLNDGAKPLLSKLLAVPALRTRYLAYVREIAQKWLAWEKLGPIARQYQSLIAADIKTDTRKLDSTEEFVKGLTEDTPGADGPPMRRPGTIGIKAFVEQRRAFLLKANH